MSNAADALLLVTRLLSALDAAIQVAGNSEKFRTLLATAVAEGRDLTDAELAGLRADAHAASDQLES